MSKIQLFLQVEGSRGVHLVELDDDAHAKNLIALAVRSGLAAANTEGALIFGPDGDSPLDPAVPLSKQGVRNKHRMHVHRCRQVNVTLHFNDVTEVVHFPPSATVDRVKKRFVQMICMSPVDATEHVLQLCGSSDRPEPDTQIGTLVCGCCNVCFDLVPIKRVEG
jgi:hypothetical protein